MSSRSGQAGLHSETLSPKKRKGKREKEERRRRRWRRRN
jgi:hypothetical protein